MGWGVEPRIRAHFEWPSRIVVPTCKLQPLETAVTYKNTSNLTWFKARSTPPLRSYLLVFLSFSNAQPQPTLFDSEKGKINANLSPFQPSQIWKFCNILFFLFDSLSSHFTLYDAICLQFQFCFDFVWSVLLFTVWSDVFFCGFGIADSLFNPRKL